MDFGELLRRERTVRRLTQEQLAELAGMTSRAIRTLESGKAMPRRRNVASLGTALGLDERGLEALLRAGGFAPAPRPAAIRARPVPGQLPREAADFVGRTELADTLAGALIEDADRRRPSGAPRVIAVSGFGGIGKTTLALRLAHRVREAFPDGQLFLDLGGGSGVDRGGDGVLAALLRDLGVHPSRVPPGAEAKSALLRSQTMDRRVLFLFDNVRDTAQVRPLLPASSQCAVLITSRAHLTALEGAQHVALAPLDATEARELLDLVRNAPRSGDRPEDEAAPQHILARCAGLPLALRIAAARLASPDGPSTETFAGLLADASGAFDALTAEDLSVRNTLAATFNLLAEVDDVTRLARRALGFFGRWPAGPVTAPCVAAGLGTLVPAVDAALGHLVGISLLQAPYQDPDSHYAQHDLVRAYTAEHAARPQAPAPDPVMGAFDWYLYALDHAVFVFADYFNRPDLDQFDGPGSPLVRPDTLPAFASGQDAINWTEREYATVVQLVRYAAQQGWDGRAVRLAVLAMPFGEQRMSLAEWVETHQIGLECARRSGLRHFESRFLSSLVSAHRWMNEFDLALDYSDQALALTRELGELDRIGIQLINRGRILRTAERFAEAAEIFNDAVEVLRGTSQLFWLANALNEVGLSLSRKGDPAAAVPYLLEGLELARAVNQGHYHVVVLLNLSLAHTLLGRYQEAEEAVRTAAAELDDPGQTIMRAELLKQHGEVFAAQGRTEEALGYYAQSLEVMESIDYPYADEVRQRIDELTTEEFPQSAGPAMTP